MLTSNTAMCHILSAYSHTNSRWSKYKK